MLQEKRHGSVNAEPAYVPGDPAAVALSGELVQICFSDMQILAQDFGRKGAAEMILNIVIQLDG